MCEITEKIYQEGLQEGKQVGLQEGKIEEKQRVAINMAQRCCATDFIAEVLGVSQSTIEEWLAEKNLTVQ